MNTINPRPGDWVSLRAKVLELHPNGVDIDLEFFSKTDQWSGWVRRDLCDPAEKPIPDEPAEGSVVLVDGVAYQRRGDLWQIASDAGGPSSWVELNADADVEVIHHA